MVTSDSANFLLGVLEGVTLAAGAPNFEESALALIKARKQLKAVVMQEVQEEDPAKTTSR